MTLIEILGKFKNVKKVGNGYLALCPAHSDHNQSLSISYGKDGKILLYCHAGCVTKDILTKLGLSESDLFPTNQNKSIDKIYHYQNADGTLIYEVVRYQPKSFAVRHKSGNGYKWGLGDVKQVLYNLPNVLEAVKRGETIYIVEGEKDSDTLCGYGLIATTASFGASSPWLDTYTESLRDAHQVVILPDNDQAGYQQCRKDC